MSKKVEARVARKHAQALKQKKRAIRQTAELQDRAVRSEYVKEAPNQIRAGANPGSIFQMHMRWTIEDADRKGAWSWGIARDWGEECWSADLRPKLLEFEKLTWAEIEAHTYGNDSKRHRAHHSMDADQVYPSGGSRLAATMKERS